MVDVENVDEVDTKKRQLDILDTLMEGVISPVDPHASGKLDIEKVEKPDLMYESIQERATNSEFDDISSANNNKAKIPEMKIPVPISLSDENSTGGPDQYVNFKF